MSFTVRTPVDLELPAALTALRKNTGKTRTQFAEAVGMGVRVDHVRRWESGMGEVTLDVLYRIAAVSGYVLTLTMEAGDGKE